ncbi:Mss4-like protein [Halenospora varia]|nr:Mss4-like protein [Halenospora varia]
MTHGSCLCNEVKYSFTGEPALQAICHCLPCRKISGGPYTTTLVIPASALTITSGALSLKTFSLTHPSGMNLKYVFCEKCGTKIYKEGDAGAFVGMVIVLAGTLDDEAIKDVKVGAELYVKDRVGWLRELGGTRQCQEFS